MSNPAAAHFYNIDLSESATPITTTCDAVDYSATYTLGAHPVVSISDGEFTGKGWKDGTRAVLGDSHEVDGGKVYVLHLDHRAEVSITVTPGDATFNAAFSIYHGELPDEAHDDSSIDPLNPVDDITFLPVASVKDAGPVDWVFTPHDGFRDTLKFSATAGQLYAGQFDAQGDWSMGNADVNYFDLDEAPILTTQTVNGAPIADPCAGKARGCQSVNNFTRFGWANGTQPTLGDSHYLSVNADFFKFHLDHEAEVTLRFIQRQASLDPAFSVYRGLRLTGPMTKRLSIPSIPLTLLHYGCWPR